MICSNTFEKSVCDECRSMVCELRKSDCVRNLTFGAKGGLGPRHASLILHLHN